uniref:hypothetical protein n=1 Tax=Agathobacter sp. TaxID=2021311 RepID=UPI004055D4E7
MDSKGQNADMPKYYRENHEKLAKEQRRLSRKQGSRKGEKKWNNYMKQQKKVAGVVHNHK